MSRLSGIVLGVYAALCILALALVPMNAASVFGMEPDPLTGIYALLLAAPWSFLTAELVSESVALTLVVTAFEMLLNGTIIYYLFRLLKRR